MNKIIIKPLTEEEKRYYTINIKDVIKEQKEINLQIALNKLKKGYIADEKDNIIDLAKWNDIEGVRKLIEGGEDLNTRDMFDFTALITASYFKHFEMAVLLLVAGADKDLKNYMGKTALDYAKRNNHKKMIQLLEYEI
jgi:hypothetical protein